MNACEKYNDMINAVERGVEARETVESILDQLTSTGLWDKRVLAEIFKFMTGMSAVEYIKDRQIMRAYRCLVIEGDEINRAMDFTDLSNHSGFDKKFKARFGLTPTEAKQRKDMVLYQEPLTWAAITEVQFAREETSMSKAIVPQLKFGIEQDKLRQYNEAIELKELYGFTEAEAEIAVNFATQCHVEMKKAFEYIDAGIESMDFDEEGWRKKKTHWEKEELQCITRYAEMLRHICEHSSLPFKKADYLVYMIRDFVFDIKKESLEGILLFEKYMDKFFGYHEFRDAFEYFTDNDGKMDWWDDYIRNITEGFGIAAAFDIAKSEYEEFMDMIEDYHTMKIGQPSHWLNRQDDIF